jgi:hypothetical protein
MMGFPLFGMRSDMLDENVMDRFSDWFLSTYFGWLLALTMVTDALLIEDDPGGINK